MTSKYARFLYQICKPTGEDGKLVTACKAHTELCRTAAGEGMVLLKNSNGVLPLKQGEKIALFGNSTIDYVKCGGGSGIVHSPYIRTVLDGFKIKEQEGKVSIFKPLSEYYANELKKVEREFMPHQDYALVDEIDISDDLFRAAADFAETAVITVGRLSEEGTDHTVTKGDFLLSEKEEALIDRLCRSFKKVVVVLDMGIMIDSSWFVEREEISAVLLAWLAGMEGGLAIADILCGDVNPSGKLVDTLAKSFDDYPTTAGFNESEDYVDYTEDIYVGYRYFETIPEAYNRVNYPFGYGLSYTDFSFEGIHCADDGKFVTACVTVTNTGSVAGKEVVQVYCGAPQGLLGKPAKVLAAFKKTDLLKPGEAQTLALRIPISSLASYDDLGKIQKAAYVLEKGEYRFYIGSSVRDVIEARYRLVLEDNVITEQLETRCAPIALKKRMLSDGSFEELPLGENKTYNPQNPASTAKAPEEEFMFDKVGETVTLDEFIAQLTDEELVELQEGHDSTGIGDTGSIGGIKRLGVPYVTVSDGPAGLRTSRECGILPTAWPCETLIGCTWNTDIAERIGKAGALEVIENNLGVWLAPGMNIHRSPFCGRNFEYYSEDPLISGKMAAAEVKGIQSQGVAPSIKHFACNNKETNRSYSDSRVSERALREIYLKGFEICVKEAKPWLIMTSYNQINGEHTTAKYELLTGILRNEWGYEGATVSDWDTKAPHVKELLAGNDIKMPKGEKDSLRAALESGEICRADLENSAKRILELILNLAQV